MNGGLGILDSETLNLQEFKKRTLQLYHFTDRKEYIETWCKVYLSSLCSSKEVRAESISQFNLKLWSLRFSRYYVMLNKQKNSLSLHNNFKSACDLDQDKKISNTWTYPSYSNQEWTMSFVMDICLTLHSKAAHI